MEIYSIKTSKITIKKLIFIITLRFDLGNIIMMKDRLSYRKIIILQHANALHYFPL
jgi:hypothetical protein